MKEKLSELLKKHTFGLKSKLNNKFSHNSVIRAFIYKQVKNFKSHEELIQFLKNNQEEAFNLGFYKDESDKLQLQSKKVFNKYLQLIPKNIKEDTNEIVRTLKEKQSTLLENFSSNSPLKNKGKAIRGLRKLSETHLKLKLGRNSKYKNHDFINLLIELSRDRSFCEGIVDIKKGKEVVPNGDTFFFHLKKFTFEEIESICNDLTLTILNIMKKRNHGLTRKIPINIDVHNIPNYSKKLKNCIPIKEERGSVQALSFLCASINLKGHQLVIGVVPLFYRMELEKRLEQLLGTISSRIKIDYINMDRGFDAGWVIDLFNNKKVKYLMPKTRTKTVKAWLHKSEGIKARIVKDFRIKESKTTLVIIELKNGEKIMFSTNLKVHEVLAHHLLSQYSHRWGIENIFKQLKNGLGGKTTSVNYNIRYLYFLFSVALYNLWILVNILISLFNFGRIREKPVIKLKTFVKRFLEVFE